MKSGILSLVTRNIAFIAFFGGHAANAELRSAHQAASLFAEEQLSCHDGSFLDPTLFIDYLVKNKYIAVNKVTRFDNASCWQLEKEYDMDGLGVFALCASTNRDFLIEQRPQYYHRAPGTNVNSFIVYTRSPSAIFKKWVDQNLIDKKSSNLITGDAKDRRVNPYGLLSGAAIVCFD